MTFVDRIRQLQLRAVAADDEDRVKSRAGEFATLRERLKAATINAARTEAGRKELQSMGIVQDEFARAQALVLETVKGMMRAVENLSVDEKFDPLKSQGSAIEAHFKKYEKSVADAWLNRLPAAPPAVDNALLDALEQAGIDVEVLRSDFESATACLLMLSSRTLPEPGDVAKLQRALDILNSSGQRIADLVDPAIADVIVRAKGSGVPYSEITPEMVSELRNLGILGRFSVVLK